MKTLAERLVHARSLKEWLQKDLAAASEISMGMIGMLEKGKRGADGKTPGSLAPLAKALGVRYEWLAYGEEPMAVTPGNISGTASMSMTARGTLTAAEVPKPLPMSPETEKRLNRFLAVLYQLDDERRGYALSVVTETLLDYLPPPPTA